MANTYDWIIATAASKINKAICPKIKNVRRKIERLFPVFPIRVNKRCPAIMLAVNRTAKVTGRIIFLIVSIQTIKGIKILGVPCGTKCVNICWAWLIQP